jgi:Spy/CpxP family protein refolding chaperone
MAVVALLFLLSAAPRLALAQAGQPALMSSAHLAAPTVLPARDTRASDDDLAGLKFTDDQKAKIDEVHQHMVLRKDAVIKSEKLNANQKEAMIAGLGRMERGEIVKLLTPEQQRDVLKKVRAAHPATQGEDAKRSLPQ